MLYQEALTELKTTGKWKLESKLIKKNCSKCYNLRYIGRHIIKIDTVKNSEGRNVRDYTYGEFEPCKCIINKQKEIETFEKKNGIVAIGLNDLKEAESINENNS